MFYPLCSTKAIDVTGSLSVGSTTSIDCKVSPDVILMTIILPVFTPITSDLSSLASAKLCTGVLGDDIGLMLNISSPLHLSILHQ